MSKDDFRVSERGERSHDEDGAAGGMLKHAKKIAIAVIGGTVVAFGVAMLVLPGPGFLVILGGLGILAIEFAFARRWLKKAKTKAKDAKDWIQGNKPPEHSGPD